MQAVIKKTSNKKPCLHTDFNFNLNDPSLYKTYLETHGFEMPNTFETQQQSALLCALRK